MNLQVAFTKALGVDKLRQFLADLGLTIAALSSLRGVQQPTSRTQYPIKEYKTIEAELTDHPAIESRKRESENELKQRGNLSCDEKLSSKGHVENQTQLPQ